MATTWFVLATVLLSVYLILDGATLGVGILHFLVPRSDPDRRNVLRSLGPIGGMEEVWLVAALGTLFLAFPLPIVPGIRQMGPPAALVSCLLVLRAASANLRIRETRASRIALWDSLFSLSSLSLALGFGVALGNVMRGVPIDPGGRFSLTFWTDFRPGPEPGLLDWFTLAVAAAAIAVLSLHGALSVVRGSRGVLQARARRAVDLAWWAAALLTVLLTLLTMRVQPRVAQSLAERPWGYVFPFTTLTGLVLVLWFSSREQDGRAYLASCVYLTGMISSAAFGLYPYLLPATTDASRGFTVFNASAPHEALRAQLAWWVPSVLVVALSVFFLRRYLAGRSLWGGEAG